MFGRDSLGVGACACCFGRGGVLGRHMGSSVLSWPARGFASGPVTVGVTMASRQEVVGKFLAWALRHGGPEDGIARKPNGEVVLSVAMLKSSRITPVLTLEEALQVIDENPRFVWRYDGDAVLARADWGHSMPAELNLAPLPFGMDYVFHATLKERVVSISQHGLHAGQRQYVHCATTFGRALRAKPSSTVVLVLDVSGLHQARANVSLAGDDIVVIDRTVPWYVVDSVRDVHGHMVPEFSAARQPFSGAPTTSAGRVWSFAKRAQEGRRR